MARQLRDRHGTELRPLLGVAGRDRVAVVQHLGIRSQEAQVAIHRVLIEADQEIQLVPVRVRLFILHSDGEQDMPSPNDGLIGVVGVQVQPTANKNTGQDVAGGRDPLAGGPANRERKVESRAGRG